jgi:predicted esterase YcpF (UPF0227 family)
MPRAEFGCRRLIRPGAEQGARLFFYFNGLHSAILEDYSSSAKIVAASRFAERQGLCFLPVSIDYRDAPRMAGEILAVIQDGIEEVVFSGSSMGGWFARILQLRLFPLRADIRTAAVAWNPAYDIERHGHLLVGPQQNYVTMSRYDWTAEHSAALAELERSVAMDTAIPWYVYVDRGDEVIGWEGSRDWHQGRSVFVDFPGGCHSFDHYDEALSHFMNHWLGAPV